MYMTLKSFEIDYLGERKVIKFEDELSFGDTEKIINSSIRFGLANGDISVDMPSYRLSILLATIKEAPFEVSVEGIRRLPSKIVKQINKEIFKVYPLAPYLVEWMETATGQTMEISEISS